MTKEQALGNEGHFHFSGCSQSVGPRGGATVNVILYRRNGQTKTWKRDTSRFEIPVKRGLYEFSYITDKTAHLWHVASECPLKLVSDAIAELRES